MAVRRAPGPRAFQRGQARDGEASAREALPYPREPCRASEPGTALLGSQGLDRVEPGGAAGGQGAAEEPHRE